jgi:steroid 5-alpha reductase family enzyme
MITAPLIASNAALVLTMMSVLWVVSVIKRDVSIVDPWWSISFLLIATNTAMQTGIGPSKLVLLSAVALWSLRLFVYLLLRNHGKPEDPRYAAFRAKYGPHRYWWVSFFQVFLLQGVLALVISLPLVFSAAASLPAPLTSYDLLGMLVFVCGFACEAIADGQLRTFRRNRTSRNQVLDSGLWRLSRHPNYFGDALLHWGLWLFAVDQPYGWVTVFAPALMTFLLVRVSGVSLLDTHLLEHKPEYADYIRRTSAFIPWPKRSAGR